MKINHLRVTILQIIEGLVSANAYNSNFHFLRAIKRSNCYHESHGKDPCHMSSNGYMITFAIAEVILSQIPDFDQVWWLSIVAAIMSFTYSAVGLGLGIAKVAGSSIFMYKEIVNYY